VVDATLIGLKSDWNASCPPQLLDIVNRFNLRDLGDSSGMLIFSKPIRFWIVPSRLIHNEDNMGNVRNIAGDVA
jgi:hypothetical protein